MNDNDNKKGDLLCSYLFPEDTTFYVDIKNEREMVADLQDLMNGWKSKGYIKRWVIAPDAIISERCKPIHIN